MPFTSITKPIQGDPTKKSLADALIDDLNYLYNQLSGLTGIALPNASFEADTDADGTPDQWTFARSGNSGTYALSGVGLADTECSHGRRAIKIVHPGGATNGGYTVTTNDYLEVTPNRPVIVAWQQKNTVATVLNKVQVLWFTAAQVAISTVNLYTSVANPTDWTPQFGMAIPPATARYAKIRLIGGDATVSTGGTIYFDDVKLGSYDFSHRFEIVNAGTAKWKAPPSVGIIEVTVIGGGGGGRAGNGGSNGGGGGGGGGGARSILAVTPGTSYAFTVGAAGGADTVVGATDTGLSAGGNSTITLGAAVLTANGGAVSAGTPGGVGGTANGGQVNTSGSSASNVTGSSGSDGGDSPESGFIGTGGIGGGAAGTAALGPGGGGGGGNASGIGGAGGPGAIIIRW